VDQKRQYNTRNQSIIGHAIYIKETNHQGIRTIHQPMFEEDHR